ncbi:MAG: DUF624 domain-containing protein [Anaerocolumna aminovalerica]|uniref:DUF624 domain-containing protein n=1 Tax=Anaerocolumna aminovalerica TaxID=1527 RepID=UPI0029148F91|nr:DUF624 domain-containing protein [Anaerocolumna aminovalerica]MDU6264446.1 DUF624 domain-containing protein [Anaerocolumna aminovalerica]
MLNELFSGERIFGFCEKVCYFFIVNTLFWLSNIPLICFFVFVDIKQIPTYLPLFMIALLPVPPAFSAVLYCMGRQLRGTEVRAFKDYKKGYRADFLLKLKLGAVQLFAIFVLWTNTKYLSEYGLGVVSMLFFVAFIFTIVLTPNLYLFASRYDMKLLDIVRVAVIITVTRPVCTLGYIAAFCFMLMLFELSAGTTVLFMISGYGFLIAFMSRPILKFLEKSQ